MRHLVGYSRGDIPVYVDLINSSAVKNIAREPHLLTLAKEALQRSALEGPRASVECDMGRPIGYDFVIEKDEDATIFYARLIRDAVFTRFTKTGVPVATQYLSLLLTLDDSGTAYDVTDVWIGQHRPPRPGSDDETPESGGYWERHAVIFQNHSVQTSTLTKTRPY